MMPPRPERTEVGRTALMCHAVLSAWRTWGGGPKQDVVPFDKLDDQQKAIQLKLVELLLANPGLTPAMLHKQWCHEMIAVGWSYGPERDEKARTHPCLRDWRTLPEYERRKSMLAIAVAGALQDFT
jgi:hypothetical protein